MIGEVLAAAASALGEQAAAVLARLGGSIGEQARECADELGALEPAARRARRASIAAVARTPTPAGLRAVHPTWIEAELAELPARARASLGSGGGDPVDVWLARWACARFPPMGSSTVRRADEAVRRPDETVRRADEAVRRAGRDGPPRSQLWSSPAWPRSIDEATNAARAEDLISWLVRIGADQLAFAIGAARVDAVEDAARRSDSEAGEIRAAAARILRPPRTGQLGSLRAAIARCSGVTLGERALVRIGARAIAPHVASRALARRRLVLRLPRSLGRIVDEELQGHALTPIDQCPTWTALAAG